VQIAFDPERAPQMCGPSVIDSKSLIHFVGRSFWQIISDGCTPSSFVDEMAYPPWAVPVRAVPRGMAEFD
jgi:hypothetical protein